MPTSASRATTIQTPMTPSRLSRRVAFLTALSPDTSNSRTVAPPPNFAGENPPDPYDGSQGYPSPQSGRRADTPLCCLLQTVETIRLGHDVQCTSLVA